MSKKLFSYFFQGLLYTAPILITVYIIYIFIVFINDKVNSLLFINIPGLGILVALMGITLIGYFGSTIIGRFVIKGFVRVINRLPFLKNIYTPIQDFVTAFIGQNKKFTEPVLLTMNAELGIQRIGFITQHDLSNIGITDNRIGVYLPFSYGIMGTLLIVKKESVTPMSISSKEAMKYIISGGLTTVDDHKDTNQSTTTSD